MFCSVGIAMFCISTGNNQGLDLSGENEDKIWENTLKYCKNLKLKLSAD
jgi:hypothetical protein